MNQLAILQQNTEPSLTVYLGVQKFLWRPLMNCVKCVPGNTIIEAFCIGIRIDANKVFVRISLNIAIDTVIETAEFFELHFLAENCCKVDTFHENLQKEKLLPEENTHLQRLHSTWELF